MKVLKKVSAIALLLVTILGGTIAPTISNAAENIVKITKRFVPENENYETRVVDHCIIQGIARKVIKDIR
mgnify:CR=1 FL=1